MTEQIGKITLELSKYPGEDLYCDGSVEDELLNIVQNHAQVEYQQLIEARGSWPILYHLSPLRENIVDFVPMTKQDKVLEVGSGCGAITGTLARKAGSVTCVDLSKKRSLINAYRHHECENVMIHVGNFQDIEPELPNDYDYICLIGVFEYGRGYIGGEHPYEEFLQILMKHLTPGGRILIAIENKYGLKYFAGCTEDHLGTYFSGIENYQEGGIARTFSRKGLEKIFTNCGISEYNFYYPYPDYKLMTAVYSDAYLPGKGELSNNLRNFDRDRMVIFDEKSAFDGIVEEGLFSVFANSYLAVIGPSFATEYVKYSNDRAREFQIKTEICRDDQGQRVVRKYPLTCEAREHVRKMAIAYEELVNRYRGSGLEINRCKLVEEENVCYAEFEYISGKPLSQLLDECLEKGDQESFWQYFDRYVALIGYHEAYPVSDYDLVFSNILVDSDRWTLIDYEWTIDKQMETRELAFRAFYCYLLENKKRERIGMEQVLARLDITQEQAQEYRERERKFQRYVEGKAVSMAVMRELIGRRLIDPQEWIQKLDNAEAIGRVQVYEDTGEGFTEENSRFVKQPHPGEHCIDLELSVRGNVNVLRIDPALDSGVCNIAELRFNGENIPLNRIELLETNGRMIKPKEVEGILHLTVFFPTTDPYICIDLTQLDRKEENILQISFEMARMSVPMIEDMIRTTKKLVKIKEKKQD